MEKTVTKEQIDWLYSFCAKHYVPWYDLQTELVDHLATAVEVQWKTTPHAPFEHTVEQIHRSFGVSGFAPLVAEKQRQLERANRRLRFAFFKQYFTLPKLAFTVMLAVVLHFVCTVVPSDFAWMILAAGFIALVVLEIVYLHKMAKLKKQQAKQLLLTNGLQNYIFFVFFYGQYWVSGRFGDDAAFVPGDWRYYLTIAILTIGAVALHSYYAYYKALHQKALSLYPHAFKPLPA